MNAISDDPIHTTIPEALDGVPHVIQARDADLVRFVGWLEAHRDEVEAHLLDAGAVLIRGVDAGTPERFERIVRVLSPQLKNDYLGTSPRDGLTDHVFEASGLPGYYPIPQHCEMTFVKEPPRRLYFGCLVAPAPGTGETPLVDFRKVWRDLAPDARARFAERGVRIVRNYAAPGAKGGLFQLKPWASMFGTTDKDVVTERARQEGFEVIWKPGDTLCLVSEHEASATHPDTGVPLWFNHSQVFHLSAASGEYRRIAALRPTLRNLAVSAFVHGLVRVQRARVASDDQPMHCTWRDGTEIPDADMEAVRDAIWKHMVRVPWQRGDVIAIDNFAVSHGRMPYAGPREICVAWT